MKNAIVRSSPCYECGAEMLWTQNAWKTGETGQAADRFRTATRSIRP